MERSRKIGIVIGVLSAIVLAISLPMLVSGIARHNREADFPNFHFDVLQTREGEWAGRPFTITDFTDETGRAFLRVTYDGQTIDAPVREPTAKDLPHLGLYNEWAALLDVIEVTRNPEGGLDPVPDAERLVLVARRTPEGYDPETWGRVRRMDWTFDFYTFKPEGGFETQTLRWPPSDHESAEERAANPIAPLDERTWQYQAAMHVIPALSVPRQKFKNTALWYEFVGPALPLAGLSALGLLIGLGFALSPRRPTRESYEQHERAAG